MRPPPLRTDASNAFAHYSMKVRVPRILDEVLERNGDYHASIRDAVVRLRDDIRDDRALPPLGLPSPDHAEWEDALARRRGRRNGGQGRRGLGPTGSSLNAMCTARS